MDEFWQLLKDLVNPESIIRHGGLYLLLFVVFAETGLFVGFFLPGDSLLFTAGLLCATGILAIHPAALVVLISIAAVAGNLLGYAFGKKVGVLLFKRKSGLLFRHEHLVTANEFYQKHGNKTMILSRFLPVVRTFVPIIAGIVKLDYKRFVVYSLIGAILWVNSMVLTGYFLGVFVPGTQNYLEYIVVFLIVITALPFIVRKVRLYIRKKSNEKTS